MKPLFPDKLIYKEVINLAEDGKMLDSDNEIAGTLKNYFCDLVNDISEKNYSSVLMDPQWSLRKLQFKNDACVKLINDTVINAGASFSF